MGSPNTVDACRFFVGSGVVLSRFSFLTTFKGFFSFRSSTLRVDVGAASRFRGMDSISDTAGELCREVDLDPCREFLPSRNLVPCLKSWSNIGGSVGLSMRAGRARDLSPRSPGRGERVLFRPLLSLHQEGKVGESIAGSASGELDYKRLENEYRNTEISTNLISCVFAALVRSRRAYPSWISRDTLDIL